MIIDNIRRAAMSQLKAAERSATEVSHRGTLEYSHVVCFDSTERDRVCAMSAQCVRAMLSPLEGKEERGRERERAEHASLCLHAYARMRMPMRGVCACVGVTHLRQHRERQSVLTKGGEERASEREGERASVWSVSRDGGVPSEWVSQSRDRTGV